MKITCNKNELTNALQIVARAVASKPQTPMYLCRELTDTSLPQIGNFFGGRDHTTVLHAYDKIAKEREENAKLHKIIKDLIESIQKM